MAAPAPVARPSRPSTVLKQNSGVNVASCLLAAPATAAAPAAAAPAPAPSEASERRSSQMRRRSTISASIQGLHPARRRERQREKRRASAVLAGGSWSGYVVTNPPREQPLNEDDCVYVFMSLRQLRDASAPNGRLSLLDNLRPRAPPAAAPPADAPAAAPITPQSLPPRLSDESRNSSAFSSTSRVSDALPPPAATATADAADGDSSGASPGSLLSENAMLREALAVERRRNAQLATFLERALEKSGEEPQPRRRRLSFNFCRRIRSSSSPPPPPTASAQLAASAAAALLAARALRRRHARAVGASRSLRRRGVLERRRLTLRGPHGARWQRRRRSDRPRPLLRHRHHRRRRAVVGTAREGEVSEERQVVRRKARAREKAILAARVLRR